MRSGLALGLGLALVASGCSAADVQDSESAQGRADLPTGFDRIGATVEAPLPFPGCELAHALSPPPAQSPTAVPAGYVFEIFEENVAENQRYELGFAGPEGRAGIRVSCPDARAASAPLARLQASKTMGRASALVGKVVRFSGDGVFAAKSSCFLDPPAKGMRFRFGGVELARDVGLVSFTMTLNVTRGEAPPGTKLIYLRCGLGQVETRQRMRPAELPPLAPLESLDAILAALQQEAKDGDIAAAE